MIRIKLLLIGCICLSTSDNTAIAQAIPDNSIDTQVNKDGNITEITGGLTSENNLFHSFQGFSIPTGNEVFFNNANTISNIFSRVTGGEISNIDGAISANGNANLFLINPSGIVFTENASLNIGGSFLVTTADSLRFDSGEFSAVSPEQSNISINLPIGLGFGSNPGDIRIEGQQNNVVIKIPSFELNTDSLPPGLEVNQGQSISLVGGNINFHGGGIQAPGGNINLVSLNGGEDVNFLALEDWFAIELENISQFDDVNFNEAAYVDVSDNMAGNITIAGRQIILDDGSVVLANTNQSTNNSINIFASEIITIQGTSGEFNADKSFSQIENITSGRVPRVPIDNNYSVSLIGADIFSEANAKGNSININTANLQIFDAGEIRTASFPGRATPGEITINANSILVQGTNNIDSLISSSITGGSVNIFSQSLEVRDGGRIKTDPFNSEDSGYLVINSDNITLQGYPIPLVPRYTGLFATPPRNSDRESINIQSKTLNILDGAKINSNSAVTRSSGSILINAESITVSGFIPFGNFVPSSISSSVDINRAGDNIDMIVDNNPTLPEASAVDINTADLSILNGARIEAVNNVGNSGSINIKAENIELNGTRPKVFNFIGGISTSTRGTSIGNGGDISIDTNSLEVRNGSIIRAISLGEGDAGNISIDADSIEISGVDRFADPPVEPQRISKINTGSLEGNGGNIFINSNSITLSDRANIATSTSGEGNGGNLEIASNTIILKENSGIVANANDGSGGNILINSDSILGIENSDITANAVGGSGGNLTISSDYLFGLVARNNATEQNDITASSEFGLSGNIQLNIFNFLTQEELLFLRHIDFASSKRLITESCFSSNTLNAGTITNYGYGGLAENSGRFFDRQPLVVETKPLKMESAFQEWHIGDPVVEATAVRENSDGIRLVAKPEFKQANENICRQAPHKNNLK